MLSCGSSRPHTHRCLDKLLVCHLMHDIGNTSLSSPKTCSPTAPPRLGSGQVQETGQQDDVIGECLFGEHRLPTRYSRKLSGQPILQSTAWYFVLLAWLTLAKLAILDCFDCGHNIFSTVLKALPSPFFRFVRPWHFAFCNQE